MFYFMDRHSSGVYINIICMLYVYSHSYIVKRYHKHMGLLTKKDAPSEVNFMIKYVLLKNHKYLIKSFLYPSSNIFCSTLFVSLSYELNFKILNRQKYYQHQDFKISYSSKKFPNTELKTFYSEHHIPQKYTIHIYFYSRQYKTTRLLISMI